MRFKDYFLHNFLFAALSPQILEAGSETLIARPLPFSFLRNAPDTKKIKRHQRKAWIFDPISRSEQRVSLIVWRPMLLSLQGQHATPPVGERKQLIPSPCVSLMWLTLPRAPQVIFWCSTCNWNSDHNN